MMKEKNGFVCLKCGDVVLSNAVTRPEKVRKKEGSDAVYVVHGQSDEYVRVSQKCPECGNGEAFRWFSRISGEHAGVGTERTVEHFRCTKCAHSWSKGS